MVEFPQNAAIMEQTKGKNNGIEQQTIDTGQSKALRITDKKGSSTRIPARQPTIAPKVTETIQLKRLYLREKNRIRPPKNEHRGTVAKEICKFLLFVYYTPDAVEIQGDSNQLCHFCKL